MVKRKKTCTIGLGAIKKNVKAFAALTPRQQLARIRRRYAVLDKKKMPTDNELAFMDAFNSIPDDPGEGHFCRPLWAFAILQLYEYDQAVSALNNCLLAYPPPPPPPPIV